ncbi:putative mechanosensitive ion channel MscS, LSM domain-containing protein [Rosa chinensis]|uniref:Mechanosensitive ion channel protein n=1 Tax=Rosa chinensis TaxID=74649 RepID=A0A2P6Q1F3_ROSCH|nr:putative mechanosensitive ion channel MscS, LSM domain-containing protein [Rosa chinensis]
MQAFLRLLSDRFLMEAAEKGLKGSNVSMSKNRSGNDGGDEVVVVVQSEEMEDEAKGSCSKGLESSAPNQISKVELQVGSHSPEITGSSNAPIPNETLTRRKSSISLGQQSMRIDSDILEEDTNLEQDGSPANKSAFKEEEEEEEEIYEKVNSSRKVNKKMLMEYIVFACSLGVIVASFTVEKLENLKVWGLEMWKLNFLFTRKKVVLYLVYGMKKSVQVFLWFGMVLLTWLFFFKFNRGNERSKTSTKILDHITWTLVSLLIGAFLWMLSTLLFKTLASKFMAVAYFDRIQESLFHQYVIETLSGPPLVEEDAKIRRSLSTGFVSLRSINNVEKKVTGKVNPARKVSVETMDTLVGAVSTRDTEITSEWEAKAAAFKIFRNVAQHGNKYIEEEDLMRFMTRAEVGNVFPLFDGAMENGKIKRKDLRSWMVNVYRERNALACSMTDTKTVLKQFEKFFTSLVIVITIVVWLLLVGIASTNLVVFLSTQFLLAAFIFGNTCKNVFEAIVFMFVTHPFDVGDRIVVDDVLLVVEEMNVLTTTFLKPNNEKVYYPNSVLCTKIISNYYRSPEMGDTVEFSIILTPVEKIDMLRKRIKEYLESKPQHWRPGHSVVVIDIEDVNKLKMALNICHTMNFQEIGERNKRRTELVIELMRTLEDLNITYSLMPQEVHLTQNKADATVSFKR